ncbi:cell envelope-related function transcriptional attenuator common domain-containing protein [Halolactibacillus halophilus]|uniref:Cell envelope-related function transcriptional attenuator common domain-containing protein n=1 Tax=Halolactibacillus halophilus TaxID=306540 RepID=A0A1I5QG20_9BACI|nr:LCP family protein [Halolactibacillus halophilus]GEM02124.1 LytR family transcriptional regulator [Halolactibacillus halophilus]SFP45215.1 cell envelope-related function transcriptional attenuator common domain-containing protein [Halolactibacillus halophilus]
MTHEKLTRRKYKKHKQKKKKILRTTIIILVALLIMIGVYLTNIYFNAKNAVDEAFDSAGRDKSELRDITVDPEKDHVSILFIGVDNGGGRDTSSNGLSDALILTTFNKNDHSIKMLSIPRDSYVYVPLRDTHTKINHAHSYGGPKASIETIENLFDIPIDYFVSINFDAFIDIVDELNGINVEVPYELYEMDSNDNKDAIHLLPGKQNLNGEEALALARTRKLDNDIERGKRQQMIISAILKRSISVNAVLNANDLISVVGDNMKTNMSFDEIKSFAPYALNKDLAIDHLEIKGSDMVTDAYYYKLDETHLTDIKQILQSHLEWEPKEN